MNLETEKLWNILPHPTPDHVIRLFGRTLGGERVIGDYARSAKEIERFASFCNGTYNCYVCPNPTLRSDGIRHTSDDVSHWSFVLIDIDPVVDEGYNPFQLTQNVIHFLSGLFGRDLFEKYKPTILDSGRGAQIWLRGDDFPFDDTITRKMARKAMSYWLNRISKRMGEVDGCIVDTSTSDLPRPMRLPGTINLKTNKLSSFIQTQEKNFPWLFSLLLAATPKEQFIEQQPTIKKGATWQDVWSTLSISAKEYLQLGKVEPGRHKVCYHTIASLKEAGLCREATLKAILRANGLRGEDHKISISDIQRCITNTFGEEEQNEEQG